MSLEKERNVYKISGTVDFTQLSEGRTIGLWLRLLSEELKEAVAIAERPVF